MLCQRIGYIANTFITKTTLRDVKIFAKRFAIENMVRDRLQNE